MESLATLHLLLIWDCTSAFSADPVHISLLAIVATSPSTESPAFSFYVHVSALTTVTFDFQFHFGVVQKFLIH